MRDAAEAAKIFFADPEVAKLDGSNEEWWKLGYAMALLAMELEKSPAVKRAAEAITVSMKASADAAVTKSCSNCLNRCMDMDMDPYCAAVNKPYGLTLRRGRAPQCANFELWQKDTRQSHG